MAKRVSGLAATCLMAVAGIVMVSPVTASAASAPGASAVVSVTTRHFGGVTETITHFKPGVALPNIAVGGCDTAESMIDFEIDTPDGPFDMCYVGHGTVTPNPALQQVESAITGSPSSGRYTHGRTGFTGCPSTQTWTGLKVFEYRPFASICKVTLN